MVSCLKLRKLQRKIFVPSELPKHVLEARVNIPAKYDSQEGGTLAKISILCTSELVISSVGKKG
jgi:hypothetical protein